MDENGKIYIKCYEKDTHKPIVVEVRLRLARRMSSRLT